MNELSKDKIFKFLFLLFVIISLIHIIYATVVMRGMYCDGAFYMLKILDNFSNGVYQVVYDGNHPRFFILALTQIPLFIVQFVLNISDKFILIKLYSLFQFLIPFMLILWNFKLTKRTGRIDILFWNLFCYSLIVSLYMIFSVVESIIGVTLLFLLWNYLVSEIDYKKTDLVYIIFLIVMMFASYEYISYVGIIIFMCHFHYVLKDKSIKNQIVKSAIGFGCLSAAIYNIFFMFNVNGEQYEAVRFIKEGINVIAHLFELNSLFSVIAVVFLVVYAIKKEKIETTEILILFLIFLAGFTYLLHIPEKSIYPMWEQHFRVWPCFILPVVFLIMHINNRINGAINKVKYTNCIFIVMLCCIFQMGWQIIDSYYWNKNIEYMKKELSEEKSFLYIPSKHEEISGLHNKNLRRYIWHGAYAATSIIFSDKYKQKTLLVNYDELQDEGNRNFRNMLYVVPFKENTISVPFGAYISIKNKYWDMSECAIALDMYNKENNIETDR